jgi:hypothetical protein
MNNKMKIIIEGYPDITKEDSGMAMIGMVCNDEDGDSDEGMFVRIQSWYEDKSHLEFKNLVQKNKRLRITIEQINGD